MPVADVRELDISLRKFKTAFAGLFMFVPLLCEFNLQAVFWKYDDRRGGYPETKFDFLGYTFRPRRSTFLFPGFAIHKE